VIEPSDATQVEAVGRALLALLDGEMRRLEERMEERLRLHLAEIDARAASPWLTTTEAAAYLRLTPEALRARVRRGTVPAHRDGDRWLFHRDELDAYVRGLHPAATIVALTDNASGPARLAPPGPGTERISFDA
jgi:excisionase family DNA binding protein